ncbi:MAG TPA: type II toxin-antitoxin system RelE/ParE family toxin [Fimbriimonadaceae bacterium]|jgi:plasmid stabilization system protein ParE
MAKQRPSLAVIYTFAARDELRGIWSYNAKRRSTKQANSYEDFLMRGIDRLADEYGQGEDVTGFPEFKSLILIKRRGGDGHVVIYEIDAAAGTVNILHVYHTKQDWPAKL